MSNEGIAGGKWVFLSLRGGYMSIFPIYQDLGNGALCSKIIHVKARYDRL